MPFLKGVTVPQEEAVTDCFASCLDGRRLQQLKTFTRPFELEVKMPLRRNFEQ